MSEGTACGALHAGSAHDPTRQRHRDAEMAAARRRHRTRLPLHFYVDRHCLSFFEFRGNMRDIPESEARALFAVPLFCDDIDSRVPLKAHGDTVEVTAGTVDADGKSAGLLVKLLYRYSPKTKIRTCQFTVFVRRPYGLERAYQLELNQHPVKFADAHKWSHEHVGALRRLGDASWEKWEYDEALAHFCAQTNISFRPPLPHPEHFYLTGDI